MLASTGRLIRVLDDPQPAAPKPAAQTSSQPIIQKPSRTPPSSLPQPPKLSATSQLGSPALSISPADNPTDLLAAIAAEVEACRACPLGSIRTRAVPGVGNPRARLLLIGEAPGAQEDAQGIPFVGPAGQLLTTALKQAGMDRSEVFIANVLKCRPPNNRDPLPDEIECCRPFLHRQIDAISPLCIAALGRIAAAMLLKRTVPIMRERGTWTEYHGRPLFLSLHPSAVLHNPNNRELFLNDIATLVQRVRNETQQ
jgi:DNA polymerase